MTAPPLALYIHWPYCARICPYCDFNVYKARDDAGLVAAMSADMAHARTLTGSRELVSIHLGGGTPSLMGPEDVAALIARARALWTATPNIEIALEANPSVLDAAKLSAFREAGIERLSLGVQTFHDTGLSLLGRDHDGTQAERAARESIARFPSVSLDLIFGWTGQSLAMWRADLETALALGPHHISTYQLTIEPGTAFARAEGRGERRGVGEDAGADFYALAENVLTSAGYRHYEVSNFARPGHRSRHNLAYWRGLDYVGIGPGAHGRITVDGVRRATLTALRPDTYMRAVSERGHALVEMEPLDADAALAERVMMGLRIDEGVRLPDDVVEKAAPLSEDGFVIVDGDRVRATSAGRRVLNAVTRQLLA